MHRKYANPASSWLTFAAAVSLLALTWLAPISSSAQAQPTPTTYYLPSRLYNTYQVDIPACYGKVYYPAEGWLPCNAPADTPVQTLDAIWPDTIRTFDLNFTDDTWLALEVHQVIDDAYPGALGVGLQYLDPNGNWASIDVPTVTTTTKHGVVQGSPLDENWAAKVPYGPWNPLPPGQYRLFTFGYVATYDGALAGYWPSRGTVKIYLFDHQLPPTEPPPPSLPPTPTPFPAGPTPPSYGDLSVLSLRAFQTVDGSELAAHRWTVVLVFPEYTSPPASAQVLATADLYVNGALFESRLVTVKSQTSYSPRDVQRGNNAVIYYLPPSWVASGGTLELRAVLDASNAVAETDEGNNAKSWSGMVFDAYPLSLALSILDPKVTDADAEAWLGEARSFLADTYPVTEVTFSYPFVRINGKLGFFGSIFDAQIVDIVRQEYHTQFAVGLFKDWAYGDGKRGFNSPWVAYAPVVGVEWPNTLAHEIGHTYLGGGEEASDALDRDGIPLPAGFIYMQSRSTLRYVSPDSTWINFMGDPHADGVNAWVNPATYNQILHAREAGQAALPAPLGGQRLHASLLAPRPAQSLSNASLLIYGSLAENGQVDLAPLMVLPGRMPQAVPNGSYTAELYAADGSLLAATTFTVNTIQPYGLDSAGPPSFMVELPYSPDASRLILSNGMREIYRLDRSPSLPTLTVSQPGGGQPVTGPVTASWSAGDADGDALVYTVFYSADDGLTWKPIALNWPGPSLDLDGAYLPGSASARLRVIAADGLGFTLAESPAFQVPAHAPQVEIIPPDPEDAPWSAGVPHALAARAADIEDSALPQAAYQWQSDRDGALGQGSLLFASLSAGAHTLTVTVTDSQGQSASASTLITVDAAASAEKPPAAGPWLPAAFLYLLGGLAGLVSLAVFGRGLWLAVTPADASLADLQKNGTSWRRRYLAGQVPPQAVSQVLNQLRTYDRRGAFWSFDPFAARWLLWDGRAWHPAAAPRLGRGRLGCALVLLLSGLSGLLLALGALVWLWLGGNGF